MSVDGDEVPAILYHGQDVRMASFKGDFPVVLVLFSIAKSNKVDILVKDEYDNTPFHFGAAGGSIEVVDFFSQQISGSRSHYIDEGNVVHETPLLRAASSDQLPMCVYLLSKNCNLFHKDSDGHTAAHHAAANGHLWTLHYLLENELKHPIYGSTQELGGLDSEGRNVLFWACVSGNATLVEYLTTQKAIHLDHQDHYGDTCLHFVSRTDRIDLAKILVRAGSNVKCQNEKGNKPRDVANSSKMRHILDSRFVFKQTRVHIILFYALVVVVYLIPSVFLPWYFYLPIFFLAFGHYLKTLMTLASHSHRKKGPEKMKPHLQLDSLIKTAQKKKRLKFGQHQETAVGFWLGWAISFTLVFIDVCLDAEFQAFRETNKLFLLVVMGTSIALFLVWAPLGLWKNNPGIIRTKHLDFPHMLNIAKDGYMIDPSAHCTTCMILKPQRSKHCRVCNVCVARMDHHCIWINNCVGYENHKWFLLFLGVHLVVMVQYFILGTELLRMYSSKTPIAIMTLWAIVCTFGLGFLFGKQLYNLARNVTENEAINWKRYNYMHEVDNEGFKVFKNSFDKGFCRNLQDKTDYYTERPPPQAASV